MLDLVEEATQKKELAFKKLSKVKKNTFNGDEIIENNNHDYAYHAIEV